MGVIITGYNPFCTDSHLDYFTRNLTVCKGDLIASSHGYVSPAVRVASATPAAEPVSLEEAKDHLRLKGIDDEDSLIDRMIGRARARVERDTGIALTAGTYRLTVLGYPMFRQALQVPIWPVHAVTRFDYYDATGTLITGASPSTYLFDGSRPTFLGLPDAETFWPTDLREFQPGVIEVTAGYESPGDVPPDLIHALLVLLDDMNAQRGSRGVEGIEASPLGYAQWIEPWVLPAV